MRGSQVIMEKQIKVIAKFVAKPGAGDKIEEIALELVRQTRAESGCLNYDLFRDTTDSTVYYMVELWENAAALESHFTENHFREAVAAITDLLAQPIGINRLEMVSKSAV